MKTWREEYDSEKKQWRIYNNRSQVPPLFILKNFGDLSDGGHLVSLLNAYSKHAELIQAYERVMMEVINNAPEGDVPPSDPWAYSLWVASKKLQDVMAKRLREDE